MINLEDDLKMGDQMRSNWWACDVLNMAYKNHAISRIPKIWQHIAYFSWNKIHMASSQALWFSNINKSNFRTVKMLQFLPICTNQKTNSFPFIYLQHLNLMSLPTNFRYLNMTSNLNLNNFNYLKWFECTCLPNIQLDAVLID